MKSAGQSMRMGGKVGFVQQSARGGKIFVRYGIESYFIPEGEGRELERPAPGEEISILVAVDRFGNAGIKAVLINGQPRYVEKLF